MVRRKYTISGFFVVLVLALSFTAIAGAAGTQPVPGRVAPTSVKPAKKITIAMIGSVNNPFMVQVKTGFNRAASVLGKLGAKVVWVDAGNQIVVSTVGNAIDAQVALGVTAIATQVPGNGICTYIKRAVAHHIAFATYNGDATCAQASGSLFFHGQDLYAAGVKAGQLMCQDTAGVASKSKPGKVGISSENLAFQALELRRKGFIAGLKKYCPWVTPVNQGVQDNADPSTIQANVRSFTSSTPTLVGVYMTGGNPYVGANEICAEHKQKTVKFIGFDFTTQNIASIKKGCFTASIGQDPFGQAYDTIMYLYNNVVAGKKPAKYFIPTKMVVGTKANINKVIAAQTSGSPGI